ncbi:UDP-3-O-(3-hydroxymyristoyl)glucosamine N-acyltransferase [Planococcus salinarum]|uniref:UDP-3-O-(3-hydroxymyristoyl)glucosamine N-acyltransferase n=1 Tax=Planococcus salinarum TaxID=622695 RepID=UPI000E3D27D0|nr:UDP-3-O-(3-hydroxymyristoyl)glucosamine N-acyltransferase [Planococcus salinarum]TAA72860.1 hypothetical protein D2909_04520 [Planococcus salinarum]
MTNISQIIEHLRNSEFNFQYKGQNELEIKRYASLDKVNSKTIYWIKNEGKLDEIPINEFKKLNVLIVSPFLKTENLSGINFIHCENPKEVYFSILTEFFVEKENLDTTVGNSVVDSTSIGEQVSIGHNCYIGPEVVIKEGVRIKNNVTIEGKVEIGKRSIIASGVVIGSDGYGYFQNSKGFNIKVPHFGGVRIGEDVEIGANTCIDKGTLSDTIIGDNVKIDNLCHIAHNVIIESNVSVIAMSMIAGSVTLKENSYIAPSASIMNQLTIGENSIVGLGAVVVKDVEANLVVAGVPAKTIRKINIE